MNKHKTRIIFHAEGNNITGTGHLARALGLSLDLTNSEPCEYTVLFCSSNTSVTNKLIGDWSFYERSPSLLFFKPTSDIDWHESSPTILSNLLNIPKEGFSDILITDGKETWNKADWTLLKSRYDVVISIDNLNALNQPIDKIIFPTTYFTVPSSVQNKDHILTGDKWLWLNPVVRQERKAIAKIFDYSIFMGGADPINRTQKALTDIFNHKTDAIVQVILGPLYQHHEELQQHVKKLPSLSVTIDNATAHYHQQLLAADVSLCAFGLSAIELIYMHQPVILYAHNEEHRNDLLAYLTRNSHDAISEEKWNNGAKPICPVEKVYYNIRESYIPLISDFQRSFDA